jgi:hypothetical protein
MLREAAADGRLAEIGDDEGLLAIMRHAARRPFPTHEDPKMTLEDTIAAAAKRRAARKAEQDEDAVVGADALARIFPNRAIPTSADRAAALHNKSKAGR